MCGLAALFEPGRRFDRQLLSAIDADLYHRGPDSGGHEEGDGWALVFRRLAVLDPQAQSDQPMHSPDGRCTLVFNGEIYNFRRLREALVQQGVEFRTGGDGEVLLQGYITWGEAVLDKLEGMYTFVLVDRARNVAIAVRDPLGIKPLYMLRRNGLTAFASEARPLHRLQPPQVDEVALRELIAFGWAAGRLSNFKGIERLPGGTIVMVSLDDGQVTERRFCDPLGTLTQSDPSTEADSHRAVKESVADHLVSDVGYTVQLSGGVDSSLVAALAAEHSSGTLASFSVNLGDHPYDEGAYQKMVVERYGLEHETVQVTAENYADMLPSAIRHMEGPTPHGGCVMLMLLCKRIKDRSKVVLTGEGADELFGGYLRYAVWRKTMWQERLSKYLPCDLLPNRWPFAGLKRLAGLDAAAYSAVYHDFRAVSRIFPGLVPIPGAREAISGKYSDFRDRLFAIDQVSYLESLLIRQDKMSMSQSVEARVPFVHMPLYKTVNRLPHDLRILGGETKPVLKRMAEHYLPNELIHRRKIGLWLPYHEWFADTSGAGQFLEALTAPDSHLAACAERDRLSALVDTFRAGDRKSGLVLQRLVEIELWLRSLSDEPKSPASIH